MTDEEKKEFEEFLQWKAERAKKEAEAKNEAQTEKETTISSDSSLVDSDSKNNDTTGPIQNEQSSDNMGVALGIAAVALIVLFVVVFGLSHKGNEPAQTSYAEDSVAVVEEAIAESAIDEKQDSIARAERISAVKKTIKIKSAYLSRPNSASGVDAYFYYKNVSDKTIKYLVWIGYPMNAVGDRVSCEIRGYRDYRGQDTGPIKPGKSSGGCWSCAWYNWTAKKLILTGIEIEYMDGSTFTIKEDEIEYIR